MPIYTYKCEHCGHRFEKLLKTMTDEMQRCPHCSAPADKVPSVPGKFQWGKSGGCS